MENQMDQTIECVKTMGNGTKFGIALGVLATLAGAGFGAYKFITGKNKKTVDVIDETDSEETDEFEDQE